MESDAEPEEPARAARPYLRVRQLQTLLQWMIELLPERQGCCGIRRLRPQLQLRLPIAKRTQFDNQLYLDVCRGV